MIIDTIDTSSCKNTLIIGRQLENNYRQIVFDCAGYGVEIESITLVHQRQGDLAPYIVTTSYEDTLTWTVSDTDTSYDGYGQAELRITFTNGLCKSIVYTTYVIKSITADAVIPSQLQSWYDAMIDYIDEHSVSPEQIEEAVAEYLDEHPVQAPVQSVNGQQGDVVLTASDVGALPSSTVIPTRTSQLTNDSGYITSETDPVFTASPAHSITSADITAWNNKSDFSGNYNDLTNKPTIPTKTSQLQNDSGFLSSAVTSFNGQTGAVTYTAPVSSVDGKTGAVSVLPSGGASGQILSKRSGSNYDVQWINAPSGGGAVDSVNGQTGTVVLDAEDVGALPDTTVIPTKTSDLTNDSGFLTSAVTSFNNQTGAVTYTAPVTSVNGQTGAVTVTVPTKTSDLTNDSGYLTSAVTTFNGQSGAVTYSAPVTSVNSLTGAVTLLAEDIPTNSIPGLQQDDVQEALEKIHYEVADLIQTKTVTLTASSWSNDTYTITDSDITATNNITFGVPVSASDTNYENIVAIGGLRATAQTAGSVTIKAMGSVPTSDITLSMKVEG